MLHHRKPVRALPYPYYFIPVLLLVLVGLGDSLYLALSHYRVHRDIGYSSFCAISKSLNCDTVSQSSYAILFGVPIAVWAVLGYSLFLVVLLLSGHRKVDRGRLWAILYIVAFGFSLYSIFLAYISSVHIKSYCLMCILSYAVNFLLLFYTWLVRRRFKTESIWVGLSKDVRLLRGTPTLSSAVAGGYLVLAALLIAFFPNYWNLAAPIKLAKAFTGETPEGHPWIGAQTPDIIIEEFTDYQCFQCKKMHFYLRQIVASQPDRIRLVHRHFPLDHKVNPIVTEPMHQGSALMSLVAIYAAREGRFWQVNDTLFNLDKKDDLIVRTLLSEAGLDTERYFEPAVFNALKKQLMTDIADGLRNKMTGTPSFIIKGEVYHGTIPPDILEHIIDADKSEQASTMIENSPIAPGSAYSIPRSRRHQICG